jgi:hypothetical protein
MYKPGGFSRLKKGSKLIFLKIPPLVLAWIGRQGTRSVAALVVVGISVPSIGAVFKPHVIEAVFVLLCIAFLRVDTSAIRTYLRRPGIIIGTTAWTVIVIPAIFGIICIAFDLNHQVPDLFLGIMLQAIASPMMAAPALAALMGLDATLVLVTLITSTALVPITAPLFAYLFIGPTLSIAPLSLGIKLFGILAGSALVGFAGQRIVGLDAIEQHHDKINGVNVLVLFVFVAAIMESVSAWFLKAPVMAIGLTVLAFAVYFVVLCLTTVLFIRVGRTRALALGFVVSQRNMGLMLAATSGALPDLTWLYFALSQFPIYLAPQLLQPIVRRVLFQERTKVAVT